MKRHIITILVAATIFAPLGAQVRFGGLDLNAASELLFEVEATAPAYGTYNALFQADIPAAEMRQLSHFPERFTRIGDSGILQIQNRFGVFRGGENGFEPITHFPAFVQGREITTGKVMGIGASPDGRFLTYLAPITAAYGELRMYDLESDDEVVISTNVELSVDDAPLKWANDSSFFVYAKRGTLYYYSIDHYDNARTLNEDLRRIGAGKINNAFWSNDGSLYYVRGSQVFRILGVEFFTRSLYQDLLKIGTMVGKLPYGFDPNFDEFWISPDGTKILVNKEGRNLTVQFLTTDDYVNTGETLSLPYLYLPRNTRVSRVLWSASDKITVMTASILHGTSQTALYRIDLADAENRSAFRRTEDVGVRGIELSPDGSTALLLTSEGATLKDYETWEENGGAKHTEPLHGVWMDNENYVIAGRYEIARYPVAGGDSTLLGLSQINEFGYAEDDGAIQVRTNGSLYERGEAGWTPIEELAVADPSVSSEDYRVYLELLSSGSYKNMVMVRNVDTVGTVPLFPRPVTRFEPFPAQDESVNMTNFAHGSRIRRREVSVVFDAIDSVAGLTEILNTLAQYGIRATFFVNGDFIRRHPGAVTEIAESGHEVGSLFFTYFDMSNAQFRINADFVKQGLARNEDDYFNVTGSELSLIWHAPYYFVSPEIISASREMNYAYIGRDVDSRDWVPRRDESGISRLYSSSADIIQTVLQQKKPGSIISMTVGRPGDDQPDGGRDDYLFQRLDLLLNNLIERGYDVVPVTTLMDHAQ